jgi:hypothetical protein
MGFVTCKKSIHNRLKSCWGHVLRTFSVVQRCVDNEAEFERERQNLQDIAKDKARKRSVSCSH